MRCGDSAAQRATPECPQAGLRGVLGSTSEPRVAAASSMSACEIGSRNNGGGRRADARACRIAPDCVAHPGRRVRRSTRCRQSRLGGVGGPALRTLVVVTSPTLSLAVALRQHRLISSPRNRFVAAVLNSAGLGTLLFDPLTPMKSSTVQRSSTSSSWPTGWGGHPVARGAARSKGITHRLLRRQHRSWRRPMGSRPAQFIDRRNRLSGRTP